MVWSEAVAVAATMPIRILPATVPTNARCIGIDACKAATIECPDTRACSLECEDNTACSDAALKCHDGTCDVWCRTGTDVCKNLRVSCGPKDGTVTCETGEPGPIVTSFAGSSCSCAGVGCAPP